MFQNWGFLLGEIWGLIVIGALVGLLAGWLIWARRSDGNGAQSQVTQLTADLERCRAMHSEKDERIRALEAEIGSLRSAHEAAEKKEAPAVSEDRDFDGDGVVEGEDEGVKPATLAAARDGGADDLKKIKGVGPKLEKVCNGLGVYHFDQIASWNADEVAWVDANLDGFKGRVSRDNWVEQAKTLAAGGETAFSKKVDKGDVY